MGESQISLHENNDVPRTGGTKGTARRSLKQQPGRNSTRPRDWLACDAGSRRSKWVPNADRTRLRDRLESEAGSRRPKCGSNNSQNATKRPADSRCWVAKSQVETQQQSSLLFKCIVGQPAKAGGVELSTLLYYTDCNIANRGIVPASDEIVMYC